MVGEPRVCTNHPGGCAEIDTESTCYRVKQEREMDLDQVIQVAFPEAVRFRQD